MQLVMLVSACDVAEHVCDSLTNIIIMNSLCAEMDY